MKKYEKPVMEVVEIEYEIKTGFGMPGLPDHGENGNQDAGSGGGTP